MGNLFDQLSVNPSYTSPVAPNQGQMPSAPGSNTIFGMDPATFAIIAGQMGSGLSPDGSPMQKVGQLASGYGQSQKVAAATAAKRKSDLEMLQYFMSGERLTPAGVAGPTKMSITTDAQGNPQYTIVGNPNANNTSGSSPGTTPQQNFDAGVPAPTQQPSQVAPATANMPGSTNNFVKGLLPDFLPAALPDLTGVSPELIAQLSGQDNSASLVMNAANILQSREQAKDVSERGWKQLGQEDIRITQADAAGKRDDYKLKQDDLKLINESYQLGQVDRQIKIQADQLAETLRRNKEIEGREDKQLSQEDNRIKIAADTYSLHKEQFDEEVSKNKDFKAAIEQIKDPTVRAYIRINPAVATTIVSGLMSKEKGNSLEVIKARALNSFIGGLEGGRIASTNPEKAADIVNKMVNGIYKAYQSSGGNSITGGVSDTMSPRSSAIKQSFLDDGLSEDEAEIGARLLGQ